MTRGSLRMRFSLAVLAWIIGGLIVVGVGTSALFTRHIESRFHAELQQHLLELAELTIVSPDGSPRLERPLSDPRYAVPDSGFYWQVDRHGFPPLRSPSVTKGGLDTALAHQPDIFHRPANGPTGVAMTYGFTRPIADGSGYLHYLIATDQRHLDDVTKAFEAELIGWLSLLALALLATGGLVILYTLKPLNRLAGTVAAVRSGSARRMGGKWPSEITPLVHDLDGLLQANEEMVSRARLEAGNLAHGLRTSLAILTDEAETLANGPAGESAITLLDQCRQIERQLDWHLARARAKASFGGQGTEMPDALLPIVAAMRRLHQARTVHFEVTGGPPATLAIDSRDFAEIVSNLADNAGKWATSHVSIGWYTQDGGLCLVFTDDGPGIPAEEIARAFAPGQRLDENIMGNGLGLAIAQDLARLAGGEVRLSARVDGSKGLVATCILPIKSA